jgi:hypothetical protein
MSEFETTGLPAAPIEEAPPERYPFWNYSDLAVFLLIAFPCLVVAVMIVRTAHLALGAGGSRAVELLPAQFLGFALSFLLLALFLRLKYRRPFWRSLGWVRPWDGFAYRAASGVALALAIAAAGAILKTPNIDMPIKELLGDKLSLVLVGISAATLGPLFEELAFRGFLMPLLVRSLGAAAGIVMSALPFALLHGPQYAWSWRHLLLITLAGSAFGWVRYRSGSTATAAVVHGAYNATLMVAFAVYGEDSPVKW